MSHDRKAYDYRNCQSLFGYSAAVHARSGGICALCGYGQDRMDFDAWRQLTVEHLIGDSQGGYPRQIREALKAKLAGAPEEAALRVAADIDAANTVTACSFCNSTTSRNRAPISMTDLIAQGPSEPTAMLAHLSQALNDILGAKQADVAWKLASVRAAYAQHVEPLLHHARLQGDQQ